MPRVPTFPRSTRAPVGASPDIGLDWSSRGSPRYLCYVTAPGAGLHWARWRAEQAPHDVPCYVNVNRERSATITRESCSRERVPEKEEGKRYLNILLIGEDMVRL